MLLDTVASTIKNSNDQARILTKAIISMQSFYLKKELMTRKNFTLKKNNAENKNNPKELWRTLKFLGMASQWEGNLKYH